MTVQNNSMVAAALIWGMFSFTFLAFALLLAAPGALALFVAMYAVFWIEIRGLKQYRDWSDAEYIREYLGGQP